MMTVDLALLLARNLISSSLVWSRVHPRALVDPGAFELAAGQALSALGGMYRAVKGNDWKPYDPMSPIEL